MYELLCSIYPTKQEPRGGHLKLLITSQLDEGDYEVTPGQGGGGSCTLLKFVCVSFKAIHDQPLIKPDMSWTWMGDLSMCPLVADTRTLAVYSLGHTWLDLFSVHTSSTSYEGLTVLSEEFECQVSFGLFAIFQTFVTGICPVVRHTVLHEVAHVTGMPVEHRVYLSKAQQCS